MTYILGINSSHDGSVALFKDQFLIGTFTKERLTRVKKHTNGNYKLLIDKLLNKFKLTMEDINYICYNDHYLDTDAYLDLLPYSNIYGDLKPHTTYVETYVKYDLDNKEVYAINHHLGHSSYSFYTSNFNKAICLSLDGSPNEYCHVSLGNDRKIKKYEYPVINSSILYDWFTYYIIGNPLYKSGTVMGLSAYGEILDKEYENYSGTDYNLYWKHLSGTDPELQKNNKTDVSKIDMDMAATLQYIFEKQIIDYLNSFPDELISEYDYNLCLSGGTFLNCNLNSKIKKYTKFKNIHVSPACSDDGLSMGYGLYLIHNILEKPRHTYTNKELIYGGIDYDISDIGVVLDLDYIVEEISKGKVVALYQGRSEFGPRALGNRSILADPRSNSMKQFINLEIKKREWFRPFGATVLEEDANEWFDIEGKSPFMLYTYNVKHPDKVPAICHVDNTCRIQTIDRLTNELFYNIISLFKDKTGVPMLLNTSFNGADEPIIETPEDAMNFFKNSNIDIIILEDRMVIKDV